MKNLILILFRIFQSIDFNTEQNFLLACSKCFKLILLVLYILKDIVCYLFAIVAAFVKKGFEKLSYHIADSEIDQETKKTSKFISSKPKTIISAADKRILESWFEKMHVTKI